MSYTVIVIVVADTHIHWRLVSLHYKHDKRPKHIAAAHASTSTSNKKLHTESCWFTHMSVLSRPQQQQHSSGPITVGLTKMRVYQWPCHC